MVALVKNTEPRYTAPFWVPESVRREHHIPTVLFTDPWYSHDEPELRRQHATLCFEALWRAGKPLTAEQVREAVNADSQARGSGPVIATTAYATWLLERMRKTRLVYGKKNPDSTLVGGHPAHPRLYIPLPYQAARSGPPAELAAADQAARERAVGKAYKRLRNGKPPYPIFRRRACFSIFQHAQAEAAVQTWQQQGTA
ncbi:hypothetical protein GPECTOR_301g819 [Gonium pectorale]|uniref:Uncharacterized protein n=1 Tax=Gonium pectorale TaxID=33097 RepID=A0A150FWZ9_GONPE|nr:hypothetical protein GPECTOR_301g819 [Gonium pectorale]|eukprot:KXZ41735.1 hypothetical protein GPECTOR_301g819 [Gonium pectorale]